MNADDVNGVDDADGEGETPPPSVEEMPGRRVVVTLDGGERSGTVVDSAYAPDDGEVLIAVDLDGAETAGADGDDAAAERVVVAEEQVRFD